MRLIQSTKTFQSLIPILKEKVLVIIIIPLISHYHTTGNLQSVKKAERIIEHNQKCHGSIIITMLYKT